MKTHWKRLVNPNYLGAYTIEDGKDLVLTIKAVQQEEIVGENGRKEAAMVARFHEPSKPFILNKTNAKMIQKLSGSPYVEDWAGQRIALFATTTRFGSDTVECLRIRPFVPKQGTSRAPQPSQSKPSPEPDIVCEDCGAIVTEHGKFSATKIAETARAKFGRALCWDCAASASAPTEEEREPESEANVATDAAVDPESEAENDRSDESE
jgi:hypothetical protein